jgi:hypothetical protein
MPSTIMSRRHPAEHPLFRRPGSNGAAISTVIAAGSGGF